MSAPINDGGPAFPTPAEEFIEGPQGRGPASAWGMEGKPGMSLRDYFAGQAPVVPDWFRRALREEKAVIPAPEISPHHVKHGTITHEECPIAHIARWRYAFADALIAARKASQ